MRSPDPASSATRTDLTIRQAQPGDLDVVLAILTEADQWLEQRGMKMWRNGEVAPDRVAQEVARGLFFLAEAGEPIGVIKFELSDPLFWPDITDHESAYVHRLAIRRTHAGTGASMTVLTWAVDHTAALGKRYLRMGCEASRHRLRAIYETFGFRYHSDRQVGPYLFARYELDVSARAS